MNRRIQVFVAAIVGAAIASAIALFGKAILDFVYSSPHLNTGGDQLQGMVNGVGQAIEILSLLCVSAISGGAIGVTILLSGGLNTDNRQSQRLRRVLTAYWGLFMLVLDTLFAGFAGPRDFPGWPWGLTLVATAGLWVAWCGWDARRAIGNLNAIIGVVAGLAVIPTGVVCIMMCIWLREPNRSENVWAVLAIFGVLMMSLILWLLIATKTTKKAVSGQHVA